MSTINAITSPVPAIITTVDNTGNLAFQTAGTTGLTVDTNQNSTFVGSVSAPNTFGFKNRIINGDIRIDQRNIGANVALTSAYTVDRWKFDRVNGGGAQIYYGQQTTDAPAGFTNSYQIKVTTGANPSGSDYTQMTQYIEGYNFADLGWGTAAAKPITVSFWAKSSVATTLSVGFRSGGFDRSYIAPFTIATPNTWQYVTITVPGCTDGTWYTNNNYGLDVHFCLGATTYYGTSTTNTWLANGVNGSWIGLAGNGIMGTTGATFNFTGFQVEKGTVATPFDFRSYGQELLLCQRYFYKSTRQDLASGTVGAVTGVGWVVDTSSPNRLFIANGGNFATTMRAFPTVVFYSEDGTVNNISYYANSGTKIPISSFPNPNDHGLSSYLQLSSNASTSAPYVFAFTASSEL
jgi:hypothetical protein